MPVFEPISATAILSLIQEQQLLEATEPMTEETDFFASGLDSLALMQLLLHVEREFGVAVPPEAVKREHFATAAALARWLAEQQKGAPV